MSRPLEMMSVVRQNRIHLYNPWHNAPNDHTRLAWPKQRLQSIIKVGKRCRDAPDSQLATEFLQTCQTKLQLHPTFAAHQLMPFINNNGMNTLKTYLGTWVAEHDRQTFWCCNQCVGWLCTLLCTSATGGVTGSFLNADGNLKSIAGRLQITAGVVRQCSQGCNPQHTQGFVASSIP